MCLSEPPPLIINSNNKTPNVESTLLFDIGFWLNFLNIKNVDYTQNKIEKNDRTCL